MADNTWNGTTGNWSDGTKWSLGHEPTSSATDLRFVVAVRDRIHLAVYGLAMYGVALDNQGETEKLAMVLKNIGHSPERPIDLRVAMEVARRSMARVVALGSFATFGKTVRVRFPFAS